MFLMVYKSLRSLSQIAKRRPPSQTDRIVDAEPNQTFFSAPEPAIFLNCLLIVATSIPPSIHDFHLKYLEINNSLFSQEE
jgi:hypothetical protein